LDVWITTAYSSWRFRWLGFIGRTRMLLPRRFRVSLVQVGDVKLFSQDLPITQEQADRASVSFARFFDQLPEDEQAVLAQVLGQAAEAGDAET